MEKIRVLHFIPGFKFGGIETVFFNTLKYMSNDIVQEVVVEENLYDKDAIINLEKMNCKVHVLPQLTFKNFNIYIKKLLKVFQKNKYDIIHSYNIIRSPLFFFVAKSNGINNRIFHARTNKTDGNIWKRSVERICLNLGTKLATKRIANSIKAGKFFFSSQEYELLNNGLDLTKYNFDKDLRTAMRKKIGIENQFVIGHVGRFTKAKNYPFLIKVFYHYQKQNKDSILLLVGDGPLHEDIILQITELGIENKVILTGQVMEPEKYYQAMDIFLFPSLYEGFGNVVIEAQTSGLKVIASDELPKATRISSIITFLTLSLPPEKWADQISSVKGNLVDRENFTMSETKYDIKETIKKQENIYRSLIKKNGEV